jgi:hypothetical protein
MTNGLDPWCQGTSKSAVNIVLIAWAIIKKALSSLYELSISALLVVYLSSSQEI